MRNDVLDYFREVDPRFKQVKDDDLTDYIRASFPEFRSEIDAAPPLSAVSGKTTLPPSQKRKAGETGFGGSLWEGLSQGDITESLPFIGGWDDVYEAQKVLRAANRAKTAFDSNSEPDQDDLKILDDYRKKVEAGEHERTAGEKIGYTAGRILKQLPAFALEFAATGGAYTAGKKATLAGLNKILGEVTEKAAKSMARRATEWAASRAIGAGAQATVGGLATGRIPSDFMQRVMPTVTLGNDDRGRLEVIAAQEGDGFAEAAYKALGSNYIEFLSERSGGVLGKILGKVPGINYAAGLKRALVDRFLKKYPSQGMAGVESFLRRAGWHGMFGEMLEERAGEVGRATLGIEKYRMPEWDQLAAEAIAFSVPGGAKAALNVMLSKVQKANGDPNAAKLTTKDLGNWEDVVRGQMADQNIVQQWNAKYAKPISEQQATSGVTEAPPPPASDFNVFEVSKPVISSQQAMAGLTQAGPQAAQDFGIIDLLAPANDIQPTADIIRTIKLGAAAGVDAQAIAVTIARDHGVAFHPARIQQIGASLGLQIDPGEAFVQPQPGVANAQEAQVQGPVRPAQPTGRALGVQTAPAPATTIAQPNAIQVQGPTAIPVQPAPAPGQTLEQEVRRAQEPPGTTPQAQAEPAVPETVVGPTAQATTAPVPAPAKAKAKRAIPASVKTTKAPAKKKLTKSEISEIVLQTVKAGDWEFQVNDQDKAVDEADNAAKQSGIKLFLSFIPKSYARFSNLFGKWPFKQVIIRRLGFGLGMYVSNTDPTTLIIDPWQLAKQGLGKVFNGGGERAGIEEGIHHYFELAVRSVAAQRKTTRSAILQSVYKEMTDEQRAAVREIYGFTEEQENQNIENFVMEFVRMLVSVDRGVLTEYATRNAKAATVYKLGASTRSLLRDILEWIKVKLGMSPAKTELAGLIEAFNGALAINEAVDASTKKAAHDIITTNAEGKIVHPFDLFMADYRARIRPAVKTILAKKFNAEEKKLGNVLIERAMDDIRDAGEYAWAKEFIDLFKTKPGEALRFTPTYTSLYNLVSNWIRSEQSQKRGGRKAKIALDAAISDEGDLIAHEVIADTKTSKTLPKKYSDAIELASNNLGLTDNDISAIQGEFTNEEYAKLLPKVNGKTITANAAGKRKKTAAAKLYSELSKILTPEELAELQALTRELSAAASTITPEQDAAYMDAVNKGDMETAQRMVDEAAKKAGYNVGPVWHGGTFDLRSGDTVFSSWTHFGTRAAAEERVGGSGVVDGLIQSVETDQDSETGKWYYSLQGIDDEQEYDSQEEAQEAGERAAVESAEYVEPPEASFTKAMLRGNYLRMPDLGTWDLWDVIRNLPKELKLSDSQREQIGDITRVGKIGDDLKLLTDILIAKGYSGIVYRNKVEDKGSESYIVFKPSDIKSADAVTRDEAGNIIPLSQRFNPEREEIYAAAETAEQATANAQLLQRQYEGEAESATQKAGHGDAVYFLNKVIARLFSPGTSPRPETLKAFKLEEHGRIVQNAGDIGARFNLQPIPSRYNQLKQKYGNPVDDRMSVLWHRIQRAAVNQARDLMKLVKDIAEDGVAKVQRLSNLVTRLQDRTMREAQKVADLDEFTRELQQYTRSAVHAHERLLADQRLDQAQRANLQGRITALNDLANRASMISDIIRDAVQVLSPDKIDYLLDPDNVAGGIAEIKREYLSRTQRYWQTHQADAVDVAIKLVVAKRIATKKLIASILIGEDPQVRQSLNAQETLILGALNRNQPAAIADLMRRMRSGSRATAKAEFVLKSLREDLNAALEDLISSQEQLAIANALVNDHEFDQWYRQVLNDAGYVGEKMPWRVNDKAFTLPISGREIATGEDVLFESPAQWQQYRTELNNAIQEIEQWLLNQANMDHPDRQYYVMSKEMLENTLLTVEMTDPSELRKPWFKGPMDTLRGLFDSIGGRTGQIGKKALSYWERIHRRSGELFQQTAGEYASAMKAAVRSHNLKVDGGEFVSSSAKWNRKVFQELAASWARQQGGFNVGDKLMSGEEVTQADMDFLKVQADITSKAFQLLGLRQLTKDTMGTTSYIRRAMKDSKYMVTRIFDADQFQFIGNFVEAYNAWNEIDEQQDRQGKQNAWARVEQMLNNYFDTHVVAFISDRNTEFAKPTIFDGVGPQGKPGAFMEIADRLRSGTVPASNRNMQWLLNELASITGFSVPEVRKEFVDEFGRIMRTFQASILADKNPDVSVLTDETVNMFTRSRNNAIAPYSFYLHGIPNDSMRLRLVYSSATVFMDDVMAALKLARDDLEKQKGRLHEASMIAGPESALERNRRALREGNTFDDWYKLDKQIRWLNDLMGKLAKDQYDLQINRAYKRLTGTIVSLVLQSLTTTAKNLTWSPMYLGYALKQLTGSNWAYPAAFFYTYANLIRSVAGLLKHGTIGAIKIATLGPYRIATGQDEADLEWRQSPIRKMLNQVFRPWIEQMAEMYQKNSWIMEHVKRGNIFVPDFVSKWDAAMINGWVNAGMLPSESEAYQGKMGKAGMWAVGLLETLVQATGGAINPIIGDVSMNAAAMSMAMGSFGLGRLQAQLADVHRRLASNHNRFNFTNLKDAANRLSYRELGFDTRMDLDKAASIFADSGLDLQDKAIEFLAKLQAGTPNAQFLTEEEAARIGETIVNMINRPTVANTPFWLRSMNAINLTVAPLLGWSTRTLAMFHKGLSQSAKETNLTAAKATMMVIGTTLIPFLVASAIGTLGAEEIDRLLKKILYAMKVKPTRQPWEMEGAGKQAQRYLLAALNGIPFIDRFANTLLNDLPTSGRQEMQIFLVQWAKQLARYVGGVIQTGDPTYGASQLVSAVVPDLKMLINRLPQFAGIRENSDQSNLLRRFGPNEMIRPPVDIRGINVTRLTPYANKMVNAAMQEDWTEFRSLYDEAVQVATRMGRKDPERVVEQMFTSRNPYNVAFKSKLSEEQYDELIAKFTPAQREAIQNVERKFQEGARILGTKVSFTEAPAVRGGTGTASAGIGYPSLTGRRNLYSLASIKPYRGRGRTTGYRRLRGSRSRYIRRRPRRFRIPRLRSLRA